MAVLNIIRIAVQVLSTLFLLVGLGLIASCLMSSGWQIMCEPGVGDIRQNGLWFDYTYAVREHVAGMPFPVLQYQQGYSSYGGGGFGGELTHSTSCYYGYPTGPGEWIMTYKFGDAVVGNDVNRAQPYQINAMVLLIITFLLGLAALIVSYCSTIRLILAITWAVLLLLAVIMGGAGLVQFYINCMMPTYRFIFTDRLILVIVGYAFWWGVAGMVALILAMITSIATAVLLLIMNRRGEEPQRPTAFFRPAMTSSQNPPKVSTFTAGSANPNPSPTKHSPVPIITSYSEIPHPVRISDNGRMKLIVRESGI